MEKRFSGIKILGMVFLNRHYKVMFELKKIFRGLQRRVDAKENQLLKLNEKMDKKRVRLDDLSKKHGKTTKLITDARNLRKVLKETQIENQGLKIELGEMKKKVEARPKLKKTIEKSLGVMSGSQTGFNGLDNVKQKYPNLPKDQIERTDVERTIARYLMGKNSGTFYVSQIIRTIEGLYLKDIKPSDRIMLLNEIKKWIERDPLCKVVKTTDLVQHYTLI